MALYEIRTLITRKRTSLISYGEFESDLNAILAARTLLRRGEALEIWRGPTLVYRSGLPQEPTVSTTPKPRPAKERRRGWGLGFWESAFKR